MSYFTPDPAAVPNGTNFVRFLSTRDLGLQIPVDFVNQPGISISAACFHNLIYEDSSFATCFSNLLALGYRRFEIDVYWDVSRRLWSLCPVELGNSSSLFSATATTAQTVSLTSVTGLASGQGAGRREDSFASLSGSSILVSSTVSKSYSIVTTATFLPTASSTAISTGSPHSTPSPDSGQELIQAGPYSCTTGMTFNFAANILASYHSSTENSLNATIRCLLMNLHAAAPLSDPTSPATQPSTSELPQGANLLSSVILANNSAYLYTSSELLSQRRDLSASHGWFDVPSSMQPVTAYFTIEQGNGNPLTHNGWPSESFIELYEGKRLLASYGYIDPQMAQYNFSGDASYIFPQGYLQDQRTVVTSAAGVDSGCFFQSGVYEIANVNNSWATTSVTPGALSLSLFDGDISNITGCGISPVLNATLGNVTAAENFLPYQEYVEASIWPWAAGEPQSTSSNGDGEQEARCATLNVTSGRWQATNCGQWYFPACRIGNSPYQWAIGTARGQYASVDRACEDNSTFDTPQTALENSYLTSTWRRYRNDNNDVNEELLWVNFNDIDAATCWVIGRDTTCPYLKHTSTNNRQVIVPVVAAILVFVVSGLTLFVKCAANRQSSKRRRIRADDGWDYEGVPS